MAWLAPAAAAGQTPAPPPDAWTLSRTACGDPDLQGVWSFAAYTSLERPEHYAGREHLTADEVAALDQEASTRADRPPLPPGDERAAAASR